MLTYIISLLHSIAQMAQVRLPRTAKSAAQAHLFQVSGFSLFTV